MMCCVFLLTSDWVCRPKSSPRPHPPLVKVTLTNPRLGIVCTLEAESWSLLNMAFFILSGPKWCLRRTPAGSVRPAPGAAPGPRKDVGHLRETSRQHRDVQDSGARGGFQPTSARQGRANWPPQRKAQSVEQKDQKRSTRHGRKDENAARKN